MQNICILKLATRIQDVVDSDDNARAVDLATDAHELGIQLSEGVFQKLFNTYMSQAKFAYTGV